MQREFLAVSECYVKSCVKCVELACSGKICSKQDDKSTNSDFLGIGIGQNRGKQKFIGLARCVADVSVDVCMLQSFLPTFSHRKTICIIGQNGNVEKWTRYI